MAIPRSPESVHLWGDTLCLNYANTVDWSAEEQHVDPAQSDVLLTVDLLNRYSRRLRLPTGETEPTRSELGRARTLRDATYRVFAAIARTEEPSSSDLGLVMTNYVEAVRSAALRHVDHYYRLDWPDPDPRTLRHHVAADAVALLQDGHRLGRVRRCPGRDCGWLFLDTSGRRQWCSMSTCGSREKMRRLYYRTRQVTPKDA